MGKVPVIRNYDPAGPIMHPDDPKRFDEPCDGNDHSEKITVTVTPWAAVGLSEDEWNALEIPAFLRRAATTEPINAIPKSTETQPAGSAAPTVAAPSASSGIGGPSGPLPEAPSKLSAATVVTGVTGGMFDHFRVDPEEIERKIKAEADQLWRNWMPTKTDRKRPRLSTYIRQVRKTYYP